MVVLFTKPFTVNPDLAFSTKGFGKPAGVEACPSGLYCGNSLQRMWLRTNSGLDGILALLALAQSFEVDKKLPVTELRRVVAVVDFQTVADPALIMLVVTSRSAVDALRAQTNRNMLALSEIVGRIVLAGWGPIVGTKISPTVNFNRKSYEIQITLPPELMGER